MCSPLKKVKTSTRSARKMLPTLEGVIRRRVLLNFRANPSTVARLLPAPLEVLTYNGFAIVGVCLIGMERLRPKGIAGALGLSSENMAHRIAIRYPTADGMKDGVFIWRRETDQCLLLSARKMDWPMSLLKARLRPGGSRIRSFLPSITPSSFSGEATAASRARFRGTDWKGFNSKRCGGK
jgi:hypothetical protein